MMTQADPNANTQTDSNNPLVRIGCVSFLNSKPLIEGFECEGAAPVRFEVPSALLSGLEASELDMALCPVIDYFRSSVPLKIVPVGGICCNGRTLTVRLFSRKPIEQLERVHVDTDSHTSVALLRVLLAERFAIEPQFVDYNANETTPASRLDDRPTAMLLIGDKVVTDSPKAVNYPYQLDLGEQWAELTGLPFMFAVWMARQDAAVSVAAKTLDELREQNASRIEAISQKYAAPLGWPIDLAQTYLGDLLHYAVGDRELQAIETFGELADKHELIPQRRELVIA